MANSVGDISGAHQFSCEDTKGGVIRIHTSKDRQHNGQKKKEKKDKQRSTKQYTGN
jgi:hypothetical protein